MNIANISEARYACKAYDPSKKIGDEHLQEIKILLRNSPSSVNSQPWHYIIVESEEGKNKILPAIADFNHSRVTNASHIVIFCGKETLDNAHIKNILESEDEMGRFSSEEIKQANDESRRYFVALNQTNPESEKKWMDKQIYLSLGTLLLGVATMGIDATPIEGFDPVKLNEVLDLPSKKLRSVVVAALGYHHPTEDFNFALKKGRLHEKEIFTML